MKIKLLPILVIIFLSLFLRLFLLDRIPTGISDDELDYIMNAKSVFLTGKDISQSWSPFSLSTPPFEYPKGELPYLVISPFIGPFPFSLFAARFPFAIFNVFLVIILFLIANKLFGKTAAIATGLLATINPWMIYFGRTAFDAPLAILFFILSFYILLITQGWKILLAFPFLFLGFFTYVGTKVIFIPFIILSSIFTWLYINKKQFGKQYIFLCLLSIVTVFYFIFSLYSKPVSTRLSELNLPSNSSNIIAVETERKLAVNSPLANLISNKFTVYSKDLINKFLGFYSPQFLFLYGDSRSTFSLWQHGMFYYLDGLFLLIGLYALYRKHKKIFIFISSLLIIAPLPSLLSNVGTTYPIRSSLAFPVLILIIGFGISYLINSDEIRKIKTQLTAVIFLLYFIFLFNFMYTYLLRNPIYNSEGFGFSGRIMAKYLDLTQKNKLNAVVVINQDLDSPPPVYKQYLFYTNNYNRDSVSQVAKNIKEKNYSFQNVQFSLCPKDLSNSTVMITNQNSKCKPKTGSKKLSIPQLSDGGEIYSIFNDKICKRYKLNRFTYGIILKNLEVENLSEEEFCLKFITNLN